MDEAIETGVMEEVAAPEATYMGNAHGQEQQEEAHSSHDNDKEMNFRRLREISERQQRELEESRQRMAFMEKLLESQVQPKAAQEPAQPNPFEGIDPSDWTTFEQTQKLAESIADKIADKRVREALEAYDAKRREEETPQRIKARFQDFDSVVTTENVEKLRALEPDVAKALSLISDVEAQAVAAYKYIKTFVPQAMENQASRERIQKNAEQPKSLSAAVANSPLSQASTFEQGLTPELKKQMFAEMQACARRS